MAITTWRRVAWALAIGWSVALLPSIGRRECQAAEPRPIRLSPVDLKQRILWGAVCEAPPGRGLAFGGEDQQAEQGAATTRLLVDGQWQAWSEKLRAANPLEPLAEHCRELARRQRLIAVHARHQYLAGTPIKSSEPHGKSSPGWKALQVAQRDLNRDCGHFADDLTKEAEDLEEYEVAQLARAQALIAQCAGTDQEPLTKGDPAEIAALLANVFRLEQAAERLSAEPASRALSPIVYVPERDVYVLFGGDHLDYLTNDLWVFDAKSKRWRELNPKLAPVARANHKLGINAAGALVLSGGYQYRLNTDYLGAQYQEVTDGEWIYDWQQNQWSPADQQPVGDRLVPAAGRTYRGGPFHPDYYLGGEQPNASPFAIRLAELKPNAWTSAQPPLLPQLNRDWGSAVIDPDHDLILRFSGGHSAHGGSDVLQYHLGSNRWELPFPVEFPLGQLYSNTEYPEGFNLNQRPWVTGHTYQSYAYDTSKRQMLFIGRLTHTYRYSPESQDWTGRFAKPPGMVYDSCFYTLTMTAGSQGVFVWTARGDVFRLDRAAERWVEVEQHGEHLPGAEVDNSTVIEDTRRHRLLFVRKPYGDQAKFNGTIYTLDLADGSTGRLQPQGSEAAAAIPYLCQLRYDPEHDLVLAGALLPAPANGPRRTPAYDCAQNRWVSLVLSGDNPHGEPGRNVSLGMVYDAKRKLFWAVDAASRVFVLRLDPARADLQPM